MSPEDLQKYHRKSSNNRKEIINFSECGCFYCLRYFNPKEIKEWVDSADIFEEGQTALCPFCGIDSVLPGSCDIRNQDFMSEMHEYWFGEDDGKIPF